MNLTARSDLLRVFTTANAVGIQKMSPVATLRTAIMIDGHTLIQALGKPHGSVTFGEHVYKWTIVYVSYKTFIKGVRKHLHKHLTLSSA